MLKKISLFLSLILSVFIAQNSTKAFAAVDSAAAAPKVAVIDVQGAILQTNEGKAAKAKIEKEVEQKKQDLLAQQKALQKMEQDFQSQQAVLSDADKATRQQEFQTKFKAFQTAQMGFEQETRQKELVATNKIYQNLIKIVQDLSTKKGLDMVFDRSAGVLLYAVKVTDLTPEVVALYNDKYPAGVKGAQK